MSGCPWLAFFLSARVLLAGCHSIPTVPQVPLPHVRLSSCVYAYTRTHVFIPIPVFLLWDCLIVVLRRYRMQLWTCHAHQQQQQLPTSTQQTTNSLFHRRPHRSQALRLAPAHTTSLPPCSCAVPLRRRPSIGARLSMGYGFSTIDAAWKALKTFSCSVEIHVLSDK